MEDIKKVSNLLGAAEERVRQLEAPRTEQLNEAYEATAQTDEGPSQSIHSEAKLIDDPESTTPESAEIHASGEQPVEGPATEHKAQYEEIESDANIPVRRRSPVPARPMRAWSHSKHDGSAGPNLLCPGLGQ